MMTCEKQILGWALALLAFSAITAAAQPSEVLVSDSRGKALFVVDVVTGDRTMVSGSAWGRPQHLIADGPSSVIVHDDFHGTLERIDLSLGKSELLAGPAQGTGIGLQGIADLQRLDGETLVGVTRGASSVFTLDLATGDREVVSQPRSGEGSAWPDVRALCVEGPTSVLVAEVKGNREEGELPRAGLHRVDLVTGEWDLVTAASDHEAGDLPSDFADPTALLPLTDDLTMILDAASHSVSFLQPGEEITSTVDLTQTDRGPFLVWPVAAHLEDENSLLVLDHDLQSIHRVSLPLGHRSLISQAGMRGTGPSLDHPRDMAVAPAGDVAWVLSGGGTRAILEVDLTSGDRSLLYDPHLVAAPHPEMPPRDLIRRGNGNLLALSAGGREIWEINTATWTQRPLMEFYLPVERIASGPGAGRIWGISGMEVLCIDLMTASTEVVWDSEVRAVPLDVVQASPTALFVSGSGPVLGSGVRILDLQSGDLIQPTYLTDVASPKNHRVIALRDNIALHVYDAENSSGIGTTDVLMTVEMTTGEQHLFSGTEMYDPRDGLVGEGPPFRSIRQFEVDEIGDVWLVDFDGTQSRLMRVDGVTGDRVEISGPNRGDGPMWLSATTLALLDGGQPNPGLRPLVRHLLGLVMISEEEIPLYDLDGSGSLDAADLILHLGP